VVSSFHVVAGQEVAFPGAAEAQVGDGAAGPRTRPGEVIGEVEIADSLTHRRRPVARAHVDQVAGAFHEQ